MKRVSKIIIENDAIKTREAALMRIQDSLEVIPELRPLKNVISGILDNTSVSIEDMENATIYLSREMNQYSDRELEDICIKIIRYLNKEEII